MRTAKKISKAKSKTKPKGRASKAGAKTDPRAIAKGKSPAPRKAAGRAKPKAARAAAKGKPKAQSKAKSKAQSAVKAKGASAAKNNAKTAPKSSSRAKGGASMKTNGRTPTARARSPRRDGTGHLDPKYARDLRALSREGQNDDDDRAFFKTPRSGDDLAEELGEEAVVTMTSGEDQGEHLIGEVVEEERGGPFVRTRGDDEYAAGTDRSNPVDATREPFPRT